jgi:ArsR family transcriptional regulator, virulence genes transcriptional regulator
MQRKDPMRDFQALEPKAAEAAALLSEMAHPKRLLVLCTLLGGEVTAGALSTTVGLSPGALSQHLSRMKAGGLVATRRDGQTINYRLANPAVTAVLATLHAQFCADP